MTKISLSSPANDALNLFLWESFGVEENGMAVSVLSALARLGLDPWAEAGRLAALPRQAAVTALARHLSLNSDSAVAAGLAKLLPEHAETPAAAKGTGGVHAALRRNAWLFVALWLVAWIAVFMITAPSPHPTNAPAQSSALYRPSTEKASSTLPVTPPT